MSRGAGVIIVTVLAICLSFFLITFRVEAVTSFLFVPMILLIFLVQSGLTDYIYFDYVLPKYQGKSLAERLVCIPAIAMHELAHAIVVVLTRSEIGEVKIGSDSGSVEFRTKQKTVSSWIATVVGSLAPGFLMPSLFVGVAIAIGFTFTPTYAKGKGIEPLFAVPDFAITNFGGLLNWISLNLSNPLIYLFLYFFITSSLGWGSSQGDWSVSGRAMKIMPLITFGVILTCIDILTAISIVNLSFVMMFYGFWLFIFLLTLMGLALAIAITLLVTLLTRAAHRKSTRRAD